MPVNCPTCSAVLPESTIQEVAKELGRRGMAKLSERRKFQIRSKGGKAARGKSGRPKIPTNCPKCGKLLPSVRMANAHCRVVIARRSVNFIPGAKWQ